MRSQNTRQPRTARLRNNPLGVGLLVTGLMVVGCAGPSQELEVDVQARLAALGLDEAQAAIQTAPLPPYVPALGTEPGPPAGWTVNPQLTDTPDAESAGAELCPPTDPRQSFVNAVDAPSGPPAEGSYEYVAEGRFETVSADGGQHAVMPAASQRSVENVNWGPGETYYEFDMVADAAHGVTRARYRVVLDDPEVVRPDAPRPVNVRAPAEVLGPSTEPPIIGTVRVGTPAQPGMYVVSVQAAGDEPMLFNDGDGMLLVRWPAFAGDSFYGQATVGGVQITYTSTVTDDNEVEACGTLLDSRAVRIAGTVAPLDGGESAVTVDATYHVATQYGGMIIADSRTTTVGSDATSSVVEAVSARLTTAPDPASDAPEPPTCPTVDPDAEVLTAGDRIDTPPVEATYRMGAPVTGEPVSVYQIAGLDTDAGKLPSTMIRTIQNVTWDPTGEEYFEYEAVDDLGGSITTTRYRVVLAPDDAEAPPPQPAVGDPGMYLVSTTHPDGEVVEYNDGAGMLMVPFPFDPAAEELYTMGGSDGAGEVVVAVYVEPNEVATACGTRVEGWRVDVVIDPGTEPGPRPEVQEYVDTRLDPPEEPEIPEGAERLPEPERPVAPESGPRSALELMRPYPDHLHDRGYVRASYSFTIAPALGSLPVIFRSSTTSVGRADVFGQSLVYTLDSEPEVPTP